MVGDEVSALAPAGSSEVVLLREDENLCPANADLRSPRDGFLVINPDLRCNNDCIHCYDNHRYHDTKAHVAPVGEIVEKTLELADRTGLRRIAIGGGEPTLFPGLAEYVRQVKEQGIFVSVLTNGRMLKFKDRLEELVDAGVDHFHVSVHSHVEQVHDAISRTAGSYRDTLSGLHNLRQAQAHTALDVSIIQVISKLNVALLEDFARFVNDLSLDLDYVLLCYCIIEMESPREQLDLLVSYRDLMPHIYAAHEVLRSTGQRVYVDNVPPCLLRGNELLCLDFHKFNYLTVTGVTAISGTETQKYRFLQQSIKSYQRSYAPQCVSCVIKPYCGGVYRSYIDAFGVSEIDPYRAHEITTRLSQVSNTHAPVSQ